MRTSMIIVALLVLGLFLSAVYSCLRITTYDWPRTPHSIMEIEQLHHAMRAYKERYSQYPPSLSDADVNDRKVRFMRHLQLAYPNSNYGVAAKHFDELRDKLRAADGLGPGSHSYTFRDRHGNVQLLDLHTLDQAEALVFWLAGFPTPCNAKGLPVAPMRTYGFNRDKDNPFLRDPEEFEAIDPMRIRTEPRMEFKQDRFADNDDDGWLEYLPHAYFDGTLAAPFVYFDAPTYVASTTPPGQPFDIVNLLGYPRQGDPKSAELAAAWGLAMPLAEQYDVTGAKPMLWRNPQSFQIISPGRDQMYSAGETGDLAAALRFSIYPTGETYTKADNYKTPTSYSTQELDNLNNLGTVTLDEARRQSGS